LHTENVIYINFVEQDVEIVCNVQGAKSLKKVNRLGSSVWDLFERCTGFFNGSGELNGVPGEDFIGVMGCCG